MMVSARKKKSYNSPGIQSLYAIDSLSFHICALYDKIKKFILHDCSFDVHEYRNQNGGNLFHITVFIESAQKFIFFFPALNHASFLLKPNINHFRLKIVSKIISNSRTAQFFDKIEYSIFVSIFERK